MRKEVVLLFLAGLFAGFGTYLFSLFQGEEKAPGVVALDHITLATPISDPLSYGEWRLSNIANGYDIEKVDIYHLDEYVKRIRRSCQNYKVESQVESFHLRWHAQFYWFDKNIPAIAAEAIESYSEREIENYVMQRVGKPKVNIYIRNKGERATVIYGFRATKLFSSGGEAGGGGALLTVLNDLTTLSIHHKNQFQELLFESPIILEPGHVTRTLIKPVMVDAAQGDGPGDMCYELSVVYSNGSDSGLRYEPIAKFLQSESIEDLAYY